MVIPKGVTLGKAPTDPRDPEFSNKWVKKMD